jgi:hypothetical protein
VIGVKGLPIVASVLVLAAVSGCGGDSAPPSVVASGPIVATTTELFTTSTAATAPPLAPSSTIEVEATIPTGELAAMPFQNRLDVAKGIFQVKLYNGTSESLAVVGVQFVWDGFTTPVAERRNDLVAGDRLDFPVPFVAATCSADGSLSSMPDLSGAFARVLLLDGRELTAPVYDVKHFARRLYLEDCQRQRIESLVGIEWTDLHEVMVAGRPVTEGILRLTRRAAVDAVTVAFVSNTINFTFLAPDAADGPIAVLDKGVTSVSVPIRFIEGRCDAHALSESSQPFKFVAQIDLGDGIERPFEVIPALEAQVPMRRRVETACEILGQTGFVGQDDLTLQTTTTLL